MQKFQARPRANDVLGVQNILARDIDGQSLRVLGLDLNSANRPLSLYEQGRLETINRRFLSGAKSLSEACSTNDQKFLDDLGIEAKIEFSLKKDKPTPTLADDLLNTKTKSLINDRTNQHAKSVLRSSLTKRFILTEDAAKRIGDAIRAYPEMLVDHGWFARTPFPQCWIEFPAKVFHHALVGDMTSDQQDDRVGYLFDGDKVYVGASNQKGEADLSPLVYRLHTPNTLLEQLEQAQTMKLSRAQLDNFYWGKTMSGNLSPQVLRGLRDQHGFSIQCGDQYRGKFEGAEWLGFSAGEVRNIIGILLMMNQPSHIIRTHEVARRKQMTIRGDRVLMSHSVVSLNLDRRSKPNTLLRRPLSAHLAPRWHEVMDHWCNDAVSRSRGWSLDDPKTHGRGDHAHVWEHEEDRLVAHCSVCGGKRWRRQMRNGRGDRSRGTIAQDRIITSEKS